MNVFGLAENGARETEEQCDDISKNVKSKYPGSGKERKVNYVKIHL